MAQYIDKDALVAEIERRTDEIWELLPNASKVENGSITTSEACNTGKYTALESFRRFIDTLEAKKVDLEKYYHDFLQKEWFGNSHVRTVSEMMAFTAKHFFELGLSVNNPITAADRGTAEGIIINLKRVEQDYRIDLTKEMEWVRNQVKKGI